jgi:hypothetical protein
LDSGIVFRNSWHASPVTSSAFQNLYGINDDGVLTKLSNSNASLITSNKNTNINLRNIILFQNPTKNKLKLKSDMDLSEHAELTNYLGKLIKKIKIKNSEIDFQNLQEGVYFFKDK